jgi:Rad3-related DNA helicase
MFIDYKNHFSKFSDKELRPQQDAALDFLDKAETSIKILRAGTGVGKSLIGTCYGIQSSRFLYLVGTKYLQDQMVESFPEISTIKGKSNYPCIRYPGLNCDDCPPGVMQCKIKQDCVYQKERNKFFNNPYKLTNYPYFLGEVNNIGKLKTQTIIADEADQLEEMLYSYLSLKFSQSIISQFKLSDPARKTATSKQGINPWLEWAENVKATITPAHSHAVARAKGSTDIQLLKREKYLRSILGKINLFLEIVDENWIYERNQTGMTFQPVWLNPTITKMLFWDHAEQFLLLSATFPTIKVLTHTLGLTSSQITLGEIETPFPAEQRPVILTNSANMVYTELDKETPKLLRDIKKILTRHKKQKGIIHSVSYKLNQAIMSIGDKRLITHEAANKYDVLNKFQYSNEPLVFVSPSSGRGLDLPYDSCRFSIVAKAPYKSLASKLIKQRLYSENIGSYWYKSITAQEIEQMAGRGMRSMDDSCVTYIMDRQACQLISRKRKLFSRGFLESLDVERL